MAARSCEMTVLLSFLLLLGCSYAFGKLVISHSPEYIRFSENGERVETHEIQHILSSALGYRLDHDLKWQGLPQGNLFKKPKAAVVFSVEGMPDAQADLMALQHKAKFDTHNTDNELDIEAVVKNIRGTVANNPLIVDFSSGHTVFSLQSHYPELFGRLPVSLSKVQGLISKGQSPLNSLDLGVLNVTEEVDSMLLGELHLIQEIVHAVASSPKLVKSRSPDFFHFRIVGFQQVLNKYGLKSQQVRDALKLLQHLIQQVTEEVKTLYQGNVLVEVVTLPQVAPDQVRKGRKLLQEPTQVPDIVNKLNLATQYAANFPIMFNIILWLLIVLTATIIAIAVCIWNMDPGRDSIIYRMTEQRIKKE